MKEKKWTKNKILNSNARISCSFGEIKIPLKEIISENYIDEILDDDGSYEGIEFELQDLVYEYFTSDLNIDIV